MIEFGQESSGAIQTRRMGRMLANFQSKNDNSLSLATPLVIVAYRAGRVQRPGKRFSPQCHRGVA